MAKVLFPLTPSFVKSTTEGRPALSLGEREDEGSVGCETWVW
jgi:hypothetical protein